VPHSRFTIRKEVKKEVKISKKFFSRGGLFLTVFEILGLKRFLIAFLSTFITLEAFARFGANVIQIKAHLILFTLM
jgi:hypothetical protein